jgi:CubicO group peptidase (beta-lactamase class C family)
MQNFETYVRLESSMKYTTIALVAMLLASCSNAASSGDAAKQQASADQMQSRPQRPVDEGLIKARGAFADYPINIVTYRAFDRMFPVAWVQPSGQSSDLGSASKPLAMTYDFAGQSYSFEDFMNRTYGTAFLVMKDGKIVAEEYRNGLDAKTQHVTMSATKSVVSMLMGIALQRKEIASIDDPVIKYAPEFKGTAFEPVTIRHVLMMRSGVKFPINGGAEPPEYFDRVIFRNQLRCADYGKEMPKLNEPGSTFAYSSLDTCIIGRVIERASGVPLYKYLEEHVWKPAGMSDPAYWVMDGAIGTGEVLGHGGLSVTARDFARIGQLMLDNGKAMGKQIIPADWVVQSTAPKAIDASTNKPSSSRYGFQWWTENGFYYGHGFGGQIIYVFPKEKVVIAKYSTYPLNSMNHIDEEHAFARAVVQSIQLKGL